LCKTSDGEGNDEYLVGYKGESFLQTGIVHAPYIPINVMPTPIVIAKTPVGKRVFIAVMEGDNPFISIRIFIRSPGQEDKDLMGNDYQGVIFDQNQMKDCVRVWELRRKWDGPLTLQEPRYVRLYRLLKDLRVLPSDGGLKIQRQLQVFAQATYDAWMNQRNDRAFDVQQITTHVVMDE
jgi:hypothetical protein